MHPTPNGSGGAGGGRGLGLSYARPTVRYLTDENSSQAEQSTEVRRRVALSLGQAEAGGRFDLVHDDSNRINLGEEELTRQRLAGDAAEIDFLGTVGERVAQRVQERYHQAVRNRYGNLIQAHRNSRLSYYFSPS